MVNKDIKTPTVTVKSGINRIHISKDDLSLDEIVGQYEAVRELKRFINEIKYKHLYKTWNKKPPRGILFTGSTGVGKTASIRALAREFGDDVFVTEIKYTDIASRYMDAPIEALKSIFKEIDEISKTRYVLAFIDEIDAMLPVRDDQLHEISKRRVDVFLEWMDGGFQSHDNITLIGATNLPGAIDPAARRPGRFDKIIEFKELQSEDIIKGLEIHLRRRKLSKSKLGEINWKELFPVVSNQKISGAGIPEILNRVIEDKIDIHRENLLDSVFGFEELSTEEKNTVIEDSKYFPDPISTEDIKETILSYISETQKFSTEKVFGFQMSAAV